jgi:hypothetical protein
MNLDRRIIRLSGQIPTLRAGCPMCRHYPDRRYCGESGCDYPDVCHRCGRPILYTLTRRYRGVNIEDI